MRVTGTSYSRDSLLDGVAIMDALLRGDADAVEFLLTNYEDLVNLAELLANMAAGFLRQHDQPQAYLNRVREEDFLR